MNEEKNHGKKEFGDNLRTEDGHTLIYSHTQDAFSEKDVHKIMTAAADIGMRVVVFPLNIKDINIFERPKPIYKVDLYAIRNMPSKEDEQKEIERNAELEKIIKEIAEMPMVKGIGSLENSYNSIITKAKEVYRG